MHVSSYTDIYADESTVKNEFGDILNIKSGDEQITKILHNLFYDILNIEFNLWPWVRNMCKYGDFYLYLMLDPELGIINIIPISPYVITRLEGKEHNPFEVTFELSEDAYFVGRNEFENYEIAHFRLLSDSMFLPYGKSMLENGRRIYKQLRLMEDAMLIHRITRAPDKRVFKIDVGNLPPGEIDGWMNKVRDESARQPLVDEKSGEYNLKFAMMNILEDFYLPVRGKDSGTNIESLTGLQFNAIEDIQYLLKKLMAAFKVPNSFLGYEEDLSGKATLAAQDVRFARTIERVQRIVVSELTKIAIVHLYIQGFRDSSLVDFTLSLTNPSTVYEMEKINLWKEKCLLAKDMVEGRFLSREWIYNNIFELSDEEMVIEQEKVREDAEFEGDLQKIVQDIIQPEQPGVPGGAPPPGPPMEQVREEDYFNAQESVDDVNRLLQQTETRGRPPEGLKYGSDKARGGRDPLGYREIMAALDVHYKNRPSKKAMVTPGIREDLSTLDKKFPSLRAKGNTPDTKQILKD